MLGVIAIDMHIRDMRALETLKFNADSQGNVSMKMDDLAVAVGCSKKTAIAIVKRLNGAGHIVVEFKSVGRRANIYRVEK